MVWPLLPSALGKEGSLAQPQAGAAAAASSAPLGDLAILVGDTVLGGIGFGLMLSMAVTVVIALLGTTFSCLNTADRMNYAIAHDREVPEVLGVLHRPFATPRRMIWVVVAFSTLIGAIGVQSVVASRGSRWRRTSAPSRSMASRGCRR